MHTVGATGQFTQYILIHAIRKDTQENTSTQANTYKYCQYAPIVLFDQYIQIPLTHTIHTKTYHYTVSEYQYTQLQSSTNQYSSICTICSSTSKCIPVQTITYNTYQYIPIHVIHANTHYVFINKY